MNVVYFIRCGNAGPIKVGTTSDLKARITALDVGPERLCIIGTIPGGRALEKTIHAALRPYRKRSEWFRPVPEVLSFIDRALADPTTVLTMAGEYVAHRVGHLAEVRRDAETAVRAANWALDRICKREGGKVVADVAGVDDDQIRKYRRNQQHMTVTTFAALYQRWPDDFALMEVILSAPHITPEEVRSNRATLENARDAIEAQLAKLRPLGDAA